MTNLLAKKHAVKTPIHRGEPVDLPSGRSLRGRFTALKCGRVSWITIVRIGMVAMLGIGSHARVAGADHSGLDFFESKIRPVLVERCYECHSAESKKVKGGLLLDTKEGLRKGGDSGTPAIVPGQPDESLLVKAIRYQSDELQMPPKKKLPESQITDFVTWVLMGAPHPTTEEVQRSKSAETSAPHWAFVPPVRKMAPALAGAAFHPIDAFILARSKAAGLAPGPRADARTLVRRATYDLHGLPPTFEEVTAFEAESLRDPQAAWGALMDRLLGSPRYGERWGRYWLDVARYADTKGYVYTDREDPRYVHAPPYRDWVIRALNEDMPYDLFVKLQIAADQLIQRGQAERGVPNDEVVRNSDSEVPAETPNPTSPHNSAFRAPNSTDLAAMGFLTLGRRFLGVSHDIIDDRIDVLTRGLQGLTVACARCHDHKYDPIPTHDYYSLYGVFDSTTERFVTLAKPSAPTPAQAAFEKELTARMERFDTAYQKAREEVAERLRRRTTDYLAALLDIKKLPSEEFYEILAPDQLNPVFVRRWHSYLQETAKGFHPVFAPWHAFAALSEDNFQTQAAAAWARLQAEAGARLNPLVREAFETTTPRSMREVAERYGRLFDGVHDFKPGPGASNRTEVNGAGRAALHAVLHAKDAPVYPPMGSLIDTHFYFDEGARVNLGKLWKAIEEWHLTADGAIPHAGILEDREPRTARVFRRGNPSNRGEEVPRQYLEVILGSKRKPFENGSGRLEMAELIASRDNPLTARVMVNRVWMHHFGAGLVKTPSDFGTRCEPPSQPELLDYLAVWFMDHGWSLKTLHRFLMLSEAYQRSAGWGIGDTGLREQRNEDGASAQSALRPSLSARTNSAHSLDPENKFLWRQTRRRLDFEALRDSLLAASGELDLAMGGRAVNLFEKPFTTRRAIYGYIDRQFLPGTLRAFDFANPDLHTPQRHQTTVPQQALFLLNSSFVVERAQVLAARLETLPAQDRVRELYRRAFQRDPETSDINRAFAFVEAASAEPQMPPAPPKPSPWQYGYAEFDPAAGKLKSFTVLPHFEKGSWQGSKAWPDARLGWLRLTAEGGHPEAGGRAVVRRWVAPFDCAVKVSGQLAHEATPGDGIRATLVHNLRGQLASWSLHNQKAATTLEAIELKDGEWLDFIVDCRDSLSHDDFKWAPVIALTKDQEKARAAGEPVEWNASKDFGGPPPAPPKPLDAWSALAQALLISNEFVFVD